MSDKALDAIDAELKDARARLAKLENEADGLRQRIEQVEAARRILAGEALSTGADQRGKLVGNVTPSARAELGKHLSGKKKRSPLTKAAWAAGYSLRALAESCGIAHSYLSQMASGERPVTDHVRATVKRLTNWDGWPR